MATRTRKTKKESEIKVKKTKEQKSVQKEKKTKEESLNSVNSNEVKVKFRKVGRGCLRKVPGCPAIIKPNQVFSCFPSLIPKAFRSSVVRLDNEKIDFEKHVQSVDMVYRVKELKNGLYNVVNKRAKKMNPKPLSQDEAIELRDQLND